MRITTQVDTLFDGRTVPDWTRPRLSRSTLRFGDLDWLPMFLAGAGLATEAAADRFQP